ncbi:TlpA family protein disulfide reductase [Alicyclobacillus mengziensis]|uniref:Redoxin domain-containing protein n=1 Tax=Alicyclobacillus mengziensis TaxID=2931921 RepID=A0A9X7VX12_9BACL|nr:TlpA disulfide reductase family protein [Alicyclobacillus mengziensis]QSO46405.1 redoxin domain-containing protein [Alicyclobacillus mengziensis]
MRLTSRIFVAAAILTGLTVTGCGVPSQTSGAGPNSAQTPSNNTIATGTGNASIPTGNAAVSSSTNAAQGPLTVGSVAPGFTLQNINGTGTVSLKQLLSKGKPILVNAWASWCPPCNMETPDLVKMSRKYGSKVEFVGVNLTMMDNVKDAKSFVNKYSIPYTVLLDSKGSFENNYTVIAEPTTFLISPQGRILDINIGMMSATQMQQLIQSVIPA